MTMICGYQNPKPQPKAPKPHSNLHEKRNPDYGYKTLRLLQNDISQFILQSILRLLCIPCDDKVHAANKLASLHKRVWMCEVCSQAPATVTCKAAAAALCVTCDCDIHSANPLARRHECFPVGSFNDAAAAAAKISGEDDDLDVNVAGI
ncbi:putative transcription factor interactor and regulator Znf-B family [Helianthus annuus]|nr:putative transcription factor interactor and regulator Znf-B family [Helianthus annuus]KAJ0479327.1 putative transcription factor interactor and regulator Znf-B family [Helianthus annuus]KAJ0662310.1 putative transcription factor interactor and regulator Znf-B family [Helianthus annuus]KAJ0669838.1 putative transcription factor interactor and regulator Znf-B family [Helianthus annuus]KAJ0847609.1 putative transcription factor interactor and regulator Znf-B family [Helianthus annuus]